MPGPRGCRHEGLKCTKEGALAKIPSAGLPCLPRPSLLGQPRQQGERRIHSLALGYKSMVCLGKELSVLVETLWTCGFWRFHKGRSQVSLKNVLMSQFRRYRKTWEGKGRQPFGS